MSGQHYRSGFTLLRSVTLSRIFTAIRWLSSFLYLCVVEADDISFSPLFISIHLPQLLYSYKIFLIGFVARRATSCSEHVHAVHARHFFYSDPTYRKPIWEILAVRQAPFNSGRDQIRVLLSNRFIDGIKTLLHQNFSH